MKIKVDDKGWAVVTDQGDPNVKPSSGVYPKTKEPADSPKAVVGLAVVGLAEAPTEPSTASEEAIQQGAMALPPPGALPKDLVALTKGDPKVA